MRMMCLLLSHEKEHTVHAAIASVLNQQYGDWTLVVMDSGKLLDAGEFKRYKGDKRIVVIRSPETPQIKAKYAIAPYCYNKMLDFVYGDLIVYLCDDDIFYPNAFHDFIMFMGANPEVLACYGSQDFGLLMGDGRFVHTGERLALEVCGKGSPYKMDCRVDYLQFCHRKCVLDLIDKPYWPQDRNESHHSDGLFMEKVAAQTPVYPVLTKVGANRRTKWSVNIPLDAEIFDCNLEAA